MPKIVGTEAETTALLYFGGVDDFFLVDFFCVRVCE